MEIQLIEPIILTNLTEDKVNTLKGIDVLKLDALATSLSNVLKPCKNSDERKQFIINSIKFN